MLCRFEIRPYRVGRLAALILEREGERTGELPLIPLNAGVAVLWENSLFFREAFEELEPRILAAARRIDPRITKIRLCE